MRAPWQGLEREGPPLIVPDGEGPPLIMLEGEGPPLIMLDGETQPAQRCRAATNSGSSLQEQSAERR